MREILFRGKKKDSGEWVEGYLLRYSPIFEELSYILPIPAVCVNEIEVEPESIGQYTGLADKNGRKIFEGDILSAHLDDSCPDDITYVQVVWNGISWCIRESTEDDVMEKEDSLIWEVCGNIFDNPELIHNDD